MLTNRWREMRESAGLELGEAAEKLGIGKSMLSQIETRNTNTTSRVLAKACEIYNCDPNDLYQKEKRETTEAATS